MHYSQPTGQLSDDTGQLEGTGYAGNGAGWNNPAMQDVPDVGPLPVGEYTIGPAYRHPELGPLTMDLTPDPSNEMFGRSLFRMHGRRFVGDVGASKGCIVMDEPVRHAVASGADRRLRVVRD